jgi:CTD small phosphatase-like protein 2
MDSPYTLVLDLDETLIHFVNTSEENDNESQEGAENDFFYMVRPYCNKFLSELSKYFEIVIFTAAMQDYADWIVDGIDHRGNIKHRLYRQHCKRQAP